MQYSTASLYLNLQNRCLDWFPRLRAISLAVEEVEGEQTNELKTLHAQVENRILILYRVFIWYCVFFSPGIVSILRPLLPQHCTKNYQPIGVTVHSHCVECFEALKVSYSDVDEGGVAVNCEKKLNFS